MQGIGNDFVVIDDLRRKDGLLTPLTPELARRICDRRFGIGADQILWLKPPEDASADARMEIYNGDGTIAEMCGNGIRAVTLHLFGEVGRSYRIETLAGIKTVELKPGNHVRVDMGPPVLGLPEGELLSLGKKQVHFFEVSVGNPHAVVFVDQFEVGLVEGLGPLIERHPRFPKRTNVEFVRVTGPRSIQVKVWERGAGVTLACGTGACAAAVAALETGRVRGPVEVELPGGKLVIEWDGGSVFLEGPAEETFRGEFYF